MHSAGHYVIRLDPAFHAMDLRPSSGGSLERLPMKAAPVARREDVAMPGVLRFRKYGAVFALQGVWATDQRDGYAPQPSRAEEELARAGAGATVEVAAVSLR